MLLIFLLLKLGFSNSFFFRIVPSSSSPLPWTYQRLGAGTWSGQASGRGSWPSPPLPCSQRAFYKRIFSEKDLFLKMKNKGRKIAVQSFNNTLIFTIWSQIHQDLKLMTYFFSSWILLWIFMRIFLWIFKTCLRRQSLSPPPSRTWRTSPPPRGSRKVLWYFITDTSNKSRVQCYLYLTVLVRQLFPTLDIRH